MSWFTGPTIPYHLLQDFDYCQRVVRANSENFPVGSLLAPARLRPHIHAVYAYARMADDFADSSEGSPKEKLQKLDDWQRRLEAAQRGEADHPVFRALAYTMQQMQLPIDPLRDLLMAFRMDITCKHYDTTQELLEYCRYSANPVGRIVLRLAGYRDETLMGYADAICTALQLTNHWQDLGEDPWNGRPLYLPREEMARFGVKEADILQRRFSAAAAELMMHLIAQTRALYLQGEPLLTKVSWPLNLELGATWAGGMAVLERIEQLGGNTLRERPSLDKRAKMGCLLRGLGRVCR
ncbi:Squalene/phytoene synthase [Magnetococcus marinus MC-1]|uniref:Squalene/phytoene synthase n=1 Tax=Magnetococcus marinus (strain ATCC BAA-1437 / JCM 17883 / MC-1) TaxID=156889 RepID=A0L4D9_MAGMM|nr:squalene synthase HpnC [Magnetococcus marinus]ABK42832.1 Squalene/phytoene synthase [Magnetococcus marinus MC-1]